MVRKVGSNQSVWATIVILAVCVLMAAGCSQSLGKKDDSVTGPVAEKETGPLPSDFEDIRIPRELKENTDATFFMQASGFSAGVLSLRGRVDGSSLIAFFKNQMARDNWQLVSFFRSMRTLMMFKKENRWCVINISEKEIFTYVEIWVAPTIGAMESGLLN
jgi:hypothetical protein